MTRCGLTSSSAKIAPERSAAKGRTAEIGACSRSPQKKIATQKRGEGEGRFHNRAPEESISKGEEKREKRRRCNQRGHRTRRADLRGRSGRGAIASETRKHSPEKTRKGGGLKH